MNSCLKPLTTAAMCHCELSCECWEVNLHSPQEQIEFLATKSILQAPLQNSKIFV